jgi:peptide/nickel transport system substrate-binding protein
VTKSAYESKKSQLSVAPLGIYYAALNTQTPPFNNINLRKAVIAASNREAYLLARGGKLVGTVATHFIYPEVPGYTQAGGAAGGGQDYISHPAGDMTVAEKYMKAAGYPSGKYTGSANVLIVGSNSAPGPQEMQIVQNGLNSLQDDDQGGAAADDVLEVLRLRQGARQRVPDGRLDRGLPRPVLGAVRAVQREGDHPDQQQQLGSPQ